MRHARATRTVLLVMPAALAAAGGCAAPAVVVPAGLAVAQAGTSAYARGELEAARRVPRADAVDAVLEALARLQLAVYSTDESIEPALVRALEDGGRDIVIQVQSISPVASKISIRVSILGDQAVSRLLLTEIDGVLDEREGIPAPKPDVP